MISFVYNVGVNIAVNAILFPRHYCDNIGIMEFVVRSMPISAIMKKFGSITEFLRHHNPDKSGPFGIAPQ